MKWEDRGRSRNLEDRRGAAGPRRAGIPLGIGGVLLVLAISAITGVALSGLLGPGPSAVQQSPPSQQELAAEEEHADLLALGEGHTAEHGLRRAERPAVRCPSIGAIAERVDEYCHVRRCGDAVPSFRKNDAGLLQRGADRDEVGGGSYGLDVLVDDPHRR